MHENSTLPTAVLRWDIFCRVVDNYGDIGVTFRLARQLVAEHDLRVRLWLDDLASLQALWPATQISARQQWLQGVEVCHWDGTVAAAIPADVVIEAFACGLPEVYLHAMAQRTPPPVWVNLEYLSAEDWVQDCHAGSSRHPRLPLTQHFYFPGFTPATGGLLRESSLLAQQAAFVADPQAQKVFWCELGLQSDVQALRVSLFGYANAALGQLLRAWEQGEQPVQAVLPQNRLLQEVEHYLGCKLAVGDSVRRGNLRLDVLPFLPQDQYDRLLWACDLNFVRGEDSFVRAQWAQQPLVWQIYQQEEEAHFEKLDAFLQRYSAQLPVDAGLALTRFWQGWNRQALAAESWQDYCAYLPLYRAHAAVWARYLTQTDDLAQGLISFCKTRV